MFERCGQSEVWQCEVEGQKRRVKEVYWKGGGVLRLNFAISRTNLKLHPATSS